MQRLKRTLLRCSEPVLETRNVRTPKLARSISGVAFSLSSNPLDLRSLRLDFKNPNEAIVTLQFDDEKWTTPLGLDGKRRFAPAGPHGLALGTVGRWLSDSEFLLDLDTVANVNHFVFNIRIDDNRAAHITVNETTGEMKDVAVEGAALK